MSSLTSFTMDVSVFGAPSRYVQGFGALSWLPKIVEQLGRRPVFVMDDGVRRLFGETWAHANFDDLVLLSFSHELTKETAEMLQSRFEVRGGDVIIGMGGGRAIDAAKALVERISLPLVTVPTIASNDAPTSKNFVLYDENHRLAEVRNLPRNADFVIVDTEILSKAPKAFFSAGLGDALSKSIEAEATWLGQGFNMFRARPTWAGLTLARESQKLLRDNAAAAYEVAGSGRTSDAFERAIEAMILLAGLGFENGGLSIAHSLTRGLSLIEDISKQPHGFQVALGTCVQLKMQDAGDLNDLRKLMKKTELPLNFKELAGRALNPDEIHTIAEASFQAPYFKNVARPFQQQDLENTLIEFNR